MNVVAHECLATKLGSESLEELLEQLVVDHHSQELKLYCMSDSSCVLSMLNPQIALKNVLLHNVIADFK